METTPQNDLNRQFLYKLFSQNLLSRSISTDSMEKCFQWLRNGKFVYPVGIMIQELINLQLSGIFTRKVWMVRLEPSSSGSSAEAGTAPRRTSPESSPRSISSCLGLRTSLKMELVNECCENARLPLIHVFDFNNFFGLWPKSYQHKMTFVHCVRVDIIWTLYKYRRNDLILNFLFSFALLF